jgi:hypothetical protein
VWNLEGCQDGAVTESPGWKTEPET